MDAAGHEVQHVVQHDERLRVPLRWWVQSTMLLATLWLAMVVAVPGLLAWAVTAGLFAVMVAALTSFGSARVVVRDGVLSAGRAHIEARFLGAAEALDAEATRRVAGREADARAFLLLRPYVKRSVRVRIVDPADPAPYWLVSTRQPDRLVQALTSLADHPAPEVS